jgi:hypothetical protein
MRTAFLIPVAALCAFLGLAACAREVQPRYPSAKGLVMAGYQGWFNAEGDGADLGWKHFEKNGEFRPGMCTIDLWPDVSEYARTYRTPFTFADGSPARVFSSHDRSTTLLHFRWMKEYGIDGVFMQRFVVSLKREKGRRNYNDILANALDAAERYDRAVCIMYDLSGMDAGDAEVLMDDWKDLVSRMRILRSPQYLHHNGKPLVAVWGVGFDDGRKYGFDQAEKIVSFLKEQGCSVLLGVPTHWRDLSMDTIPDERLHGILRQVDIVHPWFVGRFNYESYDLCRDLVRADLAWCAEAGVDYMPVLYPGFSWYNLKGGVAAPVNQIPRLGGRFFWKQVHTCIGEGAEMLYLAMFDEIDEGTAFFKCANEVPVGESPFLGFEGVPSDRYLWLAGMAARALRGEIPLTEEMPEQK